MENNAPSLAGHKCSKKYSSSFLREKAEMPGSVQNTGTQNVQSAGCKIQFSWHKTQKGLFAGCGSDTTLQSDAQGLSHASKESGSRQDLRCPHRTGSQGENQIPGEPSGSPQAGKCQPQGFRSLDRIHGWQGPFPAAPGRGSVAVQHASTAPASNPDQR